jgi:hypothetical protein
MEPIPNPKVIDVGWKSLKAERESTVSFLSL